MNKSIEKKIDEIKEIAFDKDLLSRKKELEEILSSSYYKNKRNEIKFYKSCCNEEDKKKYKELDKLYHQDIYVKEYENILDEINEIKKEIKIELEDLIK